jgi:hypothetical protein
MCRCDPVYPKPGGTPQEKKTFWMSTRHMLNAFEKAYDEDYLFKEPM